MDRMEYTRSLRNAADKHWNCAQSVLAPFAAEMGLTEDQCYALGAQFGSGMKMGATCGALTGALMVCGMLNMGDEARNELVKGFRARHQAYNCAELLKMAAAQPNFVKKNHCDGLVYEMVEELDRLLKK